MKQTRGNKKEEAVKNKSRNVVRQKETQASPWRPLWHGFPRMLSDSGRLMTGSRGHSESERAGAALQTGAPLSLGPSTQAAQPAPPAATGGAAFCPISAGFWFLLHVPSQSLISFAGKKTTGKSSKINHTTTHSRG